MRTFRPRRPRTRPVRQPSLAHLARCVRAGDRRAARTLRRRLLPEAIRLAVILVDDPVRALRLSGRAVDEALAPDGPVCRWAADPRTEVMSALRVLVARSELRDVAPSRSTDERMALVVSELCDRQGRSHRQAAEQIGVPVSEVARLHSRALTDAGCEDVPEPRCSGWSLVRRMSELTAPEAAAARGHMELCRDCSAAHTARVQARRRLRVAVPAAGGTAAAGGVWSALAGGASSVVGPAAGGAAAAALGGLALIGPGLSDTRQPAGPPEAEPPAVAAVAADRATDPVVGRRGDSQDRGDAKTAPSTGGTPTAAPAAPGQAPAPAAPDPRAPGGGATTTPVGRVTPPPSSQPLLPSIPPTGTPKPGPTVSLPPPLPTVTLPSLPQPLPTSLPDPVSVVTSAVPVPLPTISVEVSLPLP